MSKTLNNSKPKQQNKSHSNDQYEFILTPTASRTSKAQYLRASFSTRASKKTKNRDPSADMDCPVFNKDSNHATPTFILSSQKTYYKQGGNQMRQDYQQNIFQYTDQKSTLNIAKPDIKKKYCNVCRQSYEDYLDVLINHINSVLHHNKITHSKFNHYILQLTHQYNHTQSKQYQKYTHHAQKRPYIQDDSIELNFISQPHKRLKTTSSIAQNQLQRIAMLSQAFSSAYQDQVNQLALNFSNYKLNMFVNPNPYLNFLSTFKIPLEPYRPLKYLPYTPNVLHQINPAANKISCLQMDE